MMSKKRLDEMDEFVGGHLSENAISIIIHSVHESFQIFNVEAKVAKVNEAGIKVGMFIEQVVDVVIRCTRSGDGGEGNGGVSMREGSK